MNFVWAFSFCQYPTHIFTKKTTSTSGTRWHLDNAQEGGSQGAPEKLGTWRVWKQVALNLPFGTWCFEVHLSEQQKSPDENVKSSFKNTGDVVKKNDVLVSLFTACHMFFFKILWYFCVCCSNFESPFGLLTLEIYVFTKDCWKTLKMKWVCMVRPPPFFARWYFDEPQSNQQLRGLNCWLMSDQCTTVHSFYIHGMGNWVLFGMRPSFTQETWSSVASPTSRNGFKAT